MSQGDDEIVIIGSTNWSNSALRRNNETSALIKSKELAKSLLTNFFHIAIDYEASKSIHQKASPLAICRYFLEDSDLAGRMMTSRDERAFDVYLLLLKDNLAESGFNYNKIALQLGLDKKMAVNDYRRQINKTLRKLESQYNLTDEYGKEQVPEAFDIVSQKAIDNPRKTYKYVVGILRNAAVP
ncbi:MAG: hypothetical protein KAS46_05240 [Candidatus Aureabacteria bacterium]|nr:hypothetical protein [Candidatus Auribacterota bacterium]